MKFEEKLKEVRALFGEAIWCLYEEMNGRYSMEEYAFDYDDVAKLEKEFASALNELAESRKDN